MATKFLRMHHVIARTGLARSTIYLKMEQGTFPRQVSLGQRAVAWIEDEIEQWMSDCITHRKEPSTKP